MLGKGRIPTTNSKPCSFSYPCIKKMDVGVRVGWSQTQVTFQQDWRKLVTFRSWGRNAVMSSVLNMMDMWCLLDDIFISELLNNALLYKQTITFTLHPYIILVSLHTFAFLLICPGMEICVSDTMELTELVVLILQQALLCFESVWQCC